jgi:hypothetical protein
MERAYRNVFFSQILTHVSPLQRKFEHKTRTNKLRFPEFMSQLTVYLKKEKKMAKRGRPKKVVKKENSILRLIKKLIGTAKRKTFWDWLTGK